MPKPVQIPPPDLVLAIDLGASKTKAFAQACAASAIAQSYAKNDEPLLLCMQPEVADVSYDSLKDYEATKTGQTDPENTCWVGIGDEYHAVGFNLIFIFFAHQVQSLQHQRYNVLMDIILCLAVVYLSLLVITYFYIHPSDF